MSGVEFIPYTESVRLTTGGDLTFTRFPDGEGRLAIDVHGVRVSVPVSAEDMHELSVASTAMSLWDGHAGFRS